MGKDQSDPANKRENREVNFRCGTVLTGSAGCEDLVVAVSEMPPSGACGVCPLERRATKGLVPDSLSTIAHVAHNERGSRLPTRGVHRHRANMAECGTKALGFSRSIGANAPFWPARIFDAAAVTIKSKRLHAAAKQATSTIGRSS